MKKFKPTSPGRRQMAIVEYKGLTKTEPWHSLTIKLKSHAGRNSQGRITVRHQGGGNRRLYRLVDFGAGKLNIPAKVETVEYDPYRTAFISRVIYQTGERNYVLAAEGVKPGDEIVTAENAGLKNGNRLMLKNVPVGYQIFNIEMTPGRGGKIARSAGSSVEVSAQDGKYTTLKMPSREIRKVLSSGFATLGRVSNVENSLEVGGKAGRSRWLGVRPTVRGSAMNAVDHPYGGGEGKTQRGIKRPKTLWGKVTGGRKTRKKKKWSNKLIMERRKKK
ncbi:MAG: 50S ribosomal protein L2 [Candidatus Liptonbacteria bacterium RIFOXYC1_FULL_36_8]|uniref:Large ribosomal subunit protein uL2 n=3 Tax=Candidatus Liptoniibacteriota TaxID=1817909 RepID=A0A1G2CPC9_9BACT|nr:MAG: 50S ribosomal protein L2 [Candidatus Liptonbacteria bacterium RIFOXYB1_FULL_36_10]OGZ04123.1 MAG: 50S ribosomal protein L2 [Candidatus Liptonbacteria bacterium RIFOXYC1_FULL_36_8]OGZ04548.1 MAG: 50S ribosomal protein L2 [Candidatus Liptonbacteria bacterium RIFOXYD1_FULL_36_11]